MLTKLKNLIFDRKRSEEEYKIVIRVLERMNQRNSVYLPLGDFKDQREFDYNDLNRLPDIYWSLKNDNDILRAQLKSQDDRDAMFSSVMDTLLYNIEKRYDSQKENEYNE